MDSSKNKAIVSSTSSASAPASQIYNFIPIPSSRSLNNDQNNKDVEASDPPFMEVVKQNMKLFWFDRKNEIRSATGFRGQNQLPLARVKKIMKLDPEVKLVSGEASVLFVKACEIFILELTIRSWSHTEANKARTIQRADIARAIKHEEFLDFLTAVVPLDHE